MRQLHRATFIALCVCTGALAPNMQGEARELTTEEAKTFYALGLALAESVSSFELSASELNLVSQGLADGVTHQAQVRYDAYGPKVEVLAKERLNRTFEAQERIGAEFRAKALAEHNNAVVMEYGAIAIPMREGTGAHPGLADTVRIAYKGSLTDGTVFDRTQPGEPLTVPLEAAVMPCLTEGLRHMRVGAAQRLICPPVRGFAHPRIKAGSTLIYDIELLEVVQGEKP